MNRQVNVSYLLAFLVIDNLVLLQKIMSEHNSSVLYRPFYGCFLSLLTAALWGVLPVALTLCLQVMDSATITFYRFLVASIVVFFGLAISKKLPTRQLLPTKKWGLALFASVLLVSNYVTNVYGLQFLSASSAQVLMQLAPISLLIGGVWLFKESFSKWQLCGVLVLLLGLALFFKQRIPQIIDSDRESILGVGIIVCSALAWAGYALAQKPLLKLLSARQVTLIFYLAGGTLLLPITHVSTLQNMSSVQLGALAFCCANTLVAYGAFTQAMKVWYASRVSAILATQPIFTYVSMRIAQAVQPQAFYQPNLDMLAYIGGVLVVMGSIIAALGKPKRQ